MCHFNIARDDDPGRIAVTGQAVVESRPQLAIGRTLKQVAVPSGFTQPPQWLKQIRDTAQYRRCQRRAAHKAAPQRSSAQDVGMPENVSLIWSAPANG